MAEQLIKMRIQFRRDTTANWEQYKDTVIPAPGEPCYDIDAHTLKIGDGHSTYAQLPVIGGVDVKVEADGKSVVLEDGVFKLAGFDGAEIGAQPRVNADGELEWVVPSTETVEGLQAAVTGLVSDVSNIKTEVKSIQDIVGVSSTGEGSLMSRIEAVESGVNTLNGAATVEGSVLKIVKDEINAWNEKVTDNGTIDTVQELITYVANHGGEVATMAADITAIRGLIGNESVEAQIAKGVANSGHITKKEAEDTLLSKLQAAATLKHVKYEISHKPVGTLVNYGDKEIRIMIPADTKFELQNSGENADKQAYYIGFKAYAPSGAVSFKEDMAEIISDNTMHSFENNGFAGTDAYGRKYSIVWLAVAKLVDGEWVYYGANSSKKKYIGWYYSVEWYGADGKIIESDCIRINLSNPDCHNVVEPYYMGNVVKEVAVGGTVLDIINNRVEIPVGAGLKLSDEFVVDEDGTVSMKTITWDKIDQGDATIVMDGGSAN